MSLSLRCFLSALYIACTAQSLRIHHHRRNATTTSATPTIGHNDTLYDKLPGLWFETCLNGGSDPPCVAYCHENDTSCQQRAEAVASPCADIWSTYHWDSGKISDPEPGWSVVYSTYGQSSGLSSTTVSVYTTFSTATAAVVKQNVHADETNADVTITPVYALGRPSPSVSVVSVSGWTETNSWLTKAKPSCRYIAVSTSNDCGKCSIHGGSVELYYWPPATSTQAPASLITGRSTVLTEGVTLYSPTVYISLSTVYADNSCTQIGQNRTGTLLAMNPTDVSTQVHLGGKVAQSGANSYAMINYANLAGLTPVTEYENQPSCIMFGCSTILPSFNPTIVVPLALRTLDPAWADCQAALEGLYDPPIALTEQAVMAVPTLPSHNTVISSTLATDPTHAQASQCSAPSAPIPVRTSEASGPSKDPASQLADELGNLLTATGSPSLHPAASTASPSTRIPGTGGSIESADSHKQGPQDTSEAAQMGSLSSLTMTPSPTNVISSDEGSTAIGGYIASVLSLLRPETTSSAQVSPVGVETTLSGNVQPHMATPQSHAYNGDGPSTTSLQESTISDTDAESYSPPPLSIQAHQSDFVVDGMTLAPGSPITLSNGPSPITMKMTVVNGETLVELGTTRTASLGSPATSVPTISNTSSQSEDLSPATLSSVSLSDISTTTSSTGSLSSSTSAACRDPIRLKECAIGALALLILLVL